MSVNERRGFLKGFGLIGAIVGGAVATKVVVEQKAEQELVPVSAPTVDPKIIAMIEEQSPANMQLHSTYGEIKPPPPPPPPVAWTGPGNMIISSNGGYNITSSPNFGSLSIQSNAKEFVPGTEKFVSVKMVPGPDGELYININGKWKRVITT